MSPARAVAGRGRLDYRTSVWPVNQLLAGTRITEEKGGIGLLTWLDNSLKLGPEFLGTVPRIRVSHRGCSQFQPEG
jgi:hypothetical protein